MIYNTEKYKVYTWKHWMILHWILNPGLAINELILGQRVPKISLEDKTSSKPRLERTFVPCPHCHTLHDGRTWTTNNGLAFKNWYGLYCPYCQGIIPCVRNVTSLIVLAITFPVWGWYRKKLKAAWLQKQSKRYKKTKPDLKPHTFSNKRWIVSGLLWGLFMFLVMAVALPFFNNQELTPQTLFLSGFIWTLGGLAFGYTMKLFLNKTGRNIKKSNTN
ncbi:hypothetical protein ACFSQP_08910 [Bizionia sediminis]|uniref:Uncharacterized protein n=1 Tax=Bizionia sediminis TaxID=1737064 RepID=A0ABW5KU66_9FLAO